jgi:hypothetical protein
VQDRISELEDKIEIKEEILVKQHKSYERNMQELSDSIRRPNLRIMCNEEGEEAHAKGIHSMSNKIITENFPNLKKVLQSDTEASRTPNRLDQNRTSPWHTIIKTTSTENRERILKATREKK